MLIRAYRFHINNNTRSKLLSIIREVNHLTNNTRSKLSSRFQVKDQTKFEHRNDIVYCCKSPENDCDDFFIGETDRRISEIIIDHNKRDKTDIFTTCTK